MNEKLRSAYKKVLNRIVLEYHSVIIMNCLVALEEDIKCNDIERANKEHKKLDKHYKKYQNIYMQIFSCTDPKLSDGCRYVSERMKKLNNVSVCV
jgi:hypothetical protein